MDHLKKTGRPAHIQTLNNINTPSFYFETGDVFNN